ncbi:FadR/GntR family transcriptional regulator [Streptomyces tubercidicus]
MQTESSRGSVIDDTIKQLRRRIADGELVAGQKLPTERVLSQTLGVSRSSLREAIRALTVVGVLEARQGDGTYVTNLGPQLLLDAFSVLVDLSPPGAEGNLLAVRRVLESTAAAQAAAVIPEVELETLAECVAAMHQAASGVDARLEDYLNADIQFHSVIAHASGNPVLAALVESLGSRTLGTRLWRGQVDPSIFPRAHDEHVAIIQALRARDPVLAGALAASHIATLETFVAAHQQSERSNSD